MKKIGLLTLIFCFALTATLAGAKPLKTNLAGNYKLEVPQELVIIPSVPKIKLLPKPGIKTYKPNTFEKAQVASPSGFWLKPGVGSERGKEVLEYLLSSPELVDSIKLRMIAKKIKLNYLKQLKKDGVAGNSGLEITDKYIKWYESTMKIPIPVLIDVGFGSGPAMGPIPCAMKLDKDLRKIYAPVTAEKEMFFNTIMMIEDIKDAFSVSDAIANDTLDLVFCHENAHGIMFDMYGPFMDRVQKLSNIGHDSHMISDRGLAYIEGWAEAFEALYGPANPLLKLKPEERKKYRISEFLFGRQDPIRRQRYIWESTKQKTGLLKTGQQILSTEGVIAGIFYDILTSKAIKNPYHKSVSVMYYYKPVDMAAFVLGWIKMNPTDKKVLLRIFLENTNYATCSNDARKFYYDYYQAKLKYVKKKMPKKEFYSIKKLFVDHKESMFKKAMTTPKFIVSNIGNDLWVELGETHKYKGLRVNFNNCTPRFLVGLLGMNENDALKLVQTRSALGFLKGNDAFATLKEVLGADAANKIIADNGLKLMKLNPVKYNLNGWLKVVHNIPQDVMNKLAAEEAKEVK